MSKSTQSLATSEERVVPPAPETQPSLLSESSPKRALQKTSGVPIQTFWLCIFFFACMIFVIVAAGTFLNKIGFPLLSVLWVNYALFETVRVLEYTTQLTDA